MGLKSSRCRFTVAGQVCQLENAGGTVAIPKINVPGRTRTCNPRLRRPMPHPLGQGAAAAAPTNSRPAPRHTMCSACAAPGWHADTTNAHLPPTGGFSSGYPDLHRSHFWLKVHIGLLRTRKPFGNDRGVQVPLLPSASLPVKHRGAKISMFQGFLPSFFFST